MVTRNRNRSPATLVAIVFALLPVLYLGSYLALVLPQGKLVRVKRPLSESGYAVQHYRCGGEWSKRAYQLPEWIDRQVRPEVWQY